MTAPPAIAADRLPPVPASPNGVIAVSPKRTRHLFDRDADLVGGELRERGLVALAVGHLLGDDRHPAVLLEHEARRLGAHQRAHAAAAACTRRSRAAPARPR